MATWTSPDNKIQKHILCKGKWGDKPSEGSQCTITITDSPLLENYTNTVITIGDNDGDLWRAIDIGLTTMFMQEKAKFIITLNDSSISLTLELVNFTLNSFIYELDALRKYTLALHHKEKGIKFFSEKNNREAAFRFTKALKILLSIPIDVERPPEIIDQVKLSDINNLKSNLYNNLSSCYFRNQSWTMVIDLCERVFRFDMDNIKALYKTGVAYENDRNFEKANVAFTKLLQIEPENKAAVEHLAYVKNEMRKSEIEVNKMVKRMFHAVVED
ncbi:hypothetical protein NQ318_016406 [Aromia moschata]|uniref:BDBT FKBP like N-terminal domain-containing protein n=1 Tax=Aromia moschata TaxID=1265417 RepID=A0AAV8Z3F0_9CUCU|nr:hypothetical protein NQ318_016406 [Aromia moschata]